MSERDSIDDISLAESMGERVTLYRAFLLTDYLEWKQGEMVTVIGSALGSLELKEGSCLIQGSDKLIPFGSLEFMDDLDLPPCSGFVLFEPSIAETIAETMEENHERDPIVMEIPSFWALWEPLSAFLSSCFEPFEDSDTTMTIVDGKWVSNIPKVTVRVHSPSRYRLNGNEHVGYKVTTLFDMTSQSITEDQVQEKSVTVTRRFNDFETLLQNLVKEYPKYTLLSFFGSLTKFPFHSRFDKTMLEQRLIELNDCLNAVTGHPVLRGDSLVLMFLSAGGIEKDLDSQLDGVHLSDHVVDWPDYEFDVEILSKRSLNSFYQSIDVSGICHLSRLDLKSISQKHVRQSSLLDTFLSCLSTVHLETKGLSGLSNSLLSIGQDYLGGHCSECSLLGQSLLTVSFQLKLISEMDHTPSLGLFAHELANSQKSLKESTIPILAEKLSFEMGHDQMDRMGLVLYAELGHYHDVCLDGWKTSLKTWIQSQLELTRKRTKALERALDALDFFQE